MELMKNKAASGEIGYAFRSPHCQGERISEEVEVEVGEEGEGEVVEGEKATMMMSLRTLLWRRSRTMGKHWS